MSHQDAGLYKSFAMVLGALVLFTLFIIVMANIFSPSTDYSNDPLIASSVKKQIEPVGRSNVRAASDTETEAIATAVAKPVVADPVVADPAVADKAATDTDAETTTEDSTNTAGEETVTPAATEVGKSDSAAGATEGSTEVKAPGVEPVQADSSVEIPLKVRAVVATNCAGCHAKGIQGAQRNDDTAAWQGLADKGIEALTDSVINGKGKMPARAESTLDDAELQLAVQHMINKNLGGTQPAAKAEATVNEPTESSAATAETDTDAAAQTEEKEEAPAASDAETTEAVVFPDNVKAAVDTLCAACHISGVGNAPKYGDKDAWDARMAAGIDAVTASAIAGKGAMPARGGSQLTDEEIKLAIEYILTK